MTIRAFYSSPLRSYLGEQHDAIAAAMLGLLRIRHKFRVVLSIHDLERCAVDCVWSPLIEGDIGAARWPEIWTDGYAERWCLSRLEQCNALIKADNIPRRPGSRSFCDVEESFARELGHRIISATEIEMGTWRRG